MDHKELLKNSTATYLYNTFVMSIEEANRLGESYTEYIDSVGGDSSSFSPEKLKQNVVKRICNDYEWKDLSEKKKYENREKAKQDAANKYVAMSKPKLKW